MKAFSACVHYHIFRILQNGQIAGRFGLFLQFFDYLGWQVSDLEHLLVIKFIRKRQLNIDFGRTIAFFKIGQIFIEHENLRHEIVMDAAKNYKSAFTRFSELVVAPACI